MSIEIVVPDVDYLVKLHNDKAESEIGRMSPSRSFGAEINLTTWRRALTGVKLSGSDAYAFEGPSLKPEATATLEVGSIIIAVDRSWAKAQWYAGSYVKPIELCARLLRVDVSGLKSLVESDKKSWAHDLLGYLATNRPLCVDAGIAIIGERGPDLRKPAGLSTSLLRR